MGLSAAVVTANSGVVGAVLCSDVTNHETALRHFRRRLLTPSGALSNGFFLASSSAHRRSRSLAVAGRIVPCVATKSNRIPTGLGLSGRGPGPASFTSKDGARNCPKYLVAAANCSRNQVEQSTQSFIPERGTDLSTSQRKRNNYE